MVARNDITGDAIQTKTASQNYRDNYDNIFRKTKPSDNENKTDEQKDKKDDTQSQ